MNRVFQVIWSHAIGAWVVVSEFATRSGRAVQSHDARGTFARHRLVFALLLTLGPCSGAWAQTYYWDGTDTNADANGGNGTWQDGGVANWDTAQTAGASVAWSNASPADALFAFNPGTVTIGPGGVFVHRIESRTFLTLTGGTLTLTGPVIDTFTNTSINSVVAGSVGLTKTSNAMLTLGGANTYTGVTQLQAGTLRVSNTSALGAATNVASNFLVSSGTTLDLQTNLDRHLTANGAFTISGNNTTWSGAPTLTANATMTASGITQTGAWGNTGGNVLSVTVPGGLVLAGNNTYSGDTRLTSGALALNSATALSANSPLVIAGTPATQWNAVVALTPTTSLFTRALGTGADQIRWNGSGGFASVGSGTQVVNLGGTGAALTWGGTANFLGATNQLQLGTGNHVLGGGTLDFQNALVLQTGGTNYDVSAYNGVVGGTNARAKISGVISGAGNLRVGGNVAGAATGLLELSGANTYTGSLVLAGQGAYGNVLLNHATAASVDGGINIAGLANSTGNTLSLTNDFTRALGTGANQIRWNGNGGFSAAFANHFVNLGGIGDPVTWGTSGFVPNGAVFNLAATNAGNAEIDFRNPINFNNAVRTINVGLGGTARLSGVLSNGGVTYQGGGQVTVSGTNTYAGVTTIGSANVVASTIGNGGTNGNLGAATNAAANLVFNAGTLTYTGAGDTSDRNFTATGNATLFANGTGAMTLGGATAGAGSRTILLRGTSASSLVNQLTGVISNTGGGTINLQKTDANTWRLGNLANTYTGTTTLGGGVLEVANLQNGGIASSLGMSGNAASNVHINNGTLRYVGTGGSTDRAMSLDNSGGLESNGTGAIAFTASGTMVNAGTTANITFTLGGTNAGTNLFSAGLGDIVSANNENFASTALTKSGTGAWTLNAAAPTFTGNTTLNGGVLWSDSLGAVTGGFGKTSIAASHATYVVSTPMSSLLMFNGGVLGLTANSGDFERGLTQQARSFNNNGTTGAGNRGDDRFVHGVRWTGSGGFAAMGGNRSVNIGGNAVPTDLTWNTLGFVGAGQSLMFGHASADSTVAFLNAIAFGGGVRSVDVADGSAAVDAELRGALTGTGASGLQKLGAGTLLLGANNTYAGTTQINAGTLQIGNGGTTGTLGTGAVSLAASATLAFDRSNTYSVAQAITGSGLLSQRGAGTTTLLASNSAGTVEVTGGTLDIDGTLLGDTLRMGNGTLDVDGMFRANAGGTANLVSVGGTDSVLRVNAGGTLRASGSLGDGNDGLVLDGALDVAAGGLDFGDGVDLARLSGDLDGAGALAFGNGDDTLTLDDDTDLSGFTGVLDGGAQDIVDTLRLDIAGALTLASGKVVNWEALVKDNLGVATLQGTNTFQSTSVKAGTLAIEGDFTTQALSMSDGATLDIHGTLGAAAGARTTIDGSTGANTIVVANGSTLRATGDLGDGADTLDLAGTLDIGGGLFSLGAGDDIFRTYDTTAVLGNLDAGAGNDMLDVVVNTGFTVPFGGLTGFESLGKSGAGTMQVNGLASFDAVRVSGGLLAVDAGGSVAARATTIEAGATLDIAGTYAGTTDADAFDIAGTVSGGAPILLDVGDDTLTLRDGADLGVVIDGGAHGGGDRIVLQSDVAMTFDGADATNFEFLDKRGAGDATVTGTLAYAGGAQLQAGTLVVDGMLEAPTVELSDNTHLRIDGTVEGATGAAASLLGSTGTNTITIAAGATLHATGDLGDGNDILDIAGTLDTDGGTFALGAGDDTFRTHDTTNVIGDLDAGAGSDLLDVAVTSGNTVVFGGLAGFESLGKSGAGTMEVDGPASFDAIVVVGGLLDITNPASVATQSLTLASGATLRVDGSLSGTAGSDTATIAGAIVGAGRFDLGGGDDRLVVQDGADFGGLPAPVDGGAGSNALVTDIATTATLGGIANFQSLAKTNIGTLHVDGASAFANVEVVGGTLEIGNAGAITGLAGGPLATRVGTGATLQVAGAYGCSDANDAMDVSGTVSGAGTIDLCAGEDTLTLHDGAVLASVVSGGAHGAGDTVLLDVAATLAFDAEDTVQFERLEKSGAGTATIDGTGEFLQGTQLHSGSLVVAGAISTPSMDLGENATLRVAGMLSSVDGAATQLAGIGANTVHVAAGATAFLAGDLGSDNDVLDVAGTLDTRGGALLLGAGDDTFIVEDASHIVGQVDGGDGADTLVTDIATQASLGAASNFDALLKTGAGVLDVDGTVPSAFGIVNVQGGRLHVATGASLVGVNSLTVAREARLQVDGAVVGTAASDLMDVGGIVDGAGRVDLGEGDDHLLLRDAADTRGLLAALDGGAGVDTIDAQVDAGALALGRTVNFEGLLKSGAGILRVEHDASFGTTIVDGGSLTVAAGTTFASQHTQLAGGTTLRIAGAFTGTAGDDTFDSAGTVIGALAFGDGNDRATFSGGEVSRMTMLDGGNGNDTLAFSRMTLQDAALPAFANIERMALVDGSTLRMTRALDLAGGTLAIDPTSLLTAAVDVSIAGSIDNAGSLRIGPGRLAIAGDYTGRGNALLEVVVSPALGTAGGVDITGDVHGTTRIAFDSDGSTVTQATAIKVIDSPNDAAGEGTFTTARTAAGFVRLNGSYLDWSFDKQAADGAWYLRTEADSVLPEVPGYSVVPAIGFASTRAPIGIALDRVDGDDRDCGRQDPKASRSQARFDDCHGAWIAVGVDEIAMGADPGAAFSGDGSTLFVGADIFGHERASSRFRGGVMAGLQRGNYWTTGETSGPMPANTGANVRTKTGGFGAYGTFAWENGAHIDAVALGQLHAHHVGTPDGFMQKVIGESASVSLRGGKPFAPAQGWSLEPRLQVGATRSLWQDLVDDNGNRIALVDDTVGTARADLRIERAFDAAGGTHWQPWMTLGVEDTFGEAADAATVGDALAMPNHALDLSATVDVGFEANVADRISWYGALSYGTSLRGTDAEHREATLGLRVRW